jgi:hypothetical protein
MFYSSIIAELWLQGNARQQNGCADLAVASSSEATHHNSPAWRWVALVPKGG